VASIRLRSHHSHNQNVALIVSFKEKSFVNVFGFAEMRQIFVSEAKTVGASTEVERIKQAYQQYDEANLASRLWSTVNRGNQTIVSERTSKLHDLLAETGFLPLNTHRILDVGCGNGDVLASCLTWGARPENLHGVELLENRVIAAKQRHPNINFELGNAEHLPYPDSYFDLVMFFTVFSSILDPAMRRHVAAESIRILKPGGAIVWYDFRYRNRRNPHTRPMTKDDIIELFPHFHLKLAPVTLLPPLARRLGLFTNYLYPLLATIAPLRTHLIGLLVKSTSDCLK